MIRNADLIYPVPPGYEDSHFLYVFEAGGLVDGANYQDLAVRVADYDFLLRKIDGLGSVLDPGFAALAGQFLLKDKERYPTAAAPVYITNTSGASWPMVPELKYPQSSLITFDLYRVLRGMYFSAASGFSVPASQIVFYGARRKLVSGKQPTQARPYRLRPFSYQMIVNINWDVFIYNPPGVIAGFSPTRPFYQRIENNDFELWAVMANNVTPGAFAPVQAKTVLYDADEQARSNAPALVDLTAYNSAFIPGSVIAPPILYQVGSQIRLDVQSMVFAADPAPGFPVTAEFVFVGAERVPL